MKKIISLLVVLAMLMAVVPAVFADEPLSGSFIAAEGTNMEWTAPATGTATVSTGTGTGMLVVDEGSTLFTTGSGEFACVEGTTYLIKHFVTGGDMINWSVEVAGGAGGSETNGVLNIESYSYADWTAPQDGSVKFTISVAGANVAVLNGWTPLGEAADSVTVDVTAGTTYSIYPGYDVTTDCTVTWEYVEGGAGAGGGEGTGGATPDYDFELGNNAVALDANDYDGVTYTYIAEQTGTLNVVVSELSYDFYGSSQTYDDSSWGYFGNQFVLLINDNPFYEHTASADVTAGDTVTIILCNTYGRESWGTITLSYAEGGAGSGSEGEDLNANYQGSGAEADPYIIDSIPVNLGVTLTPMANDLYFQYTVTEAGVISFGDTEATVWPIVNGNWNYNSNPVEVVVGDVVVFNVFGTYNNVYVPIEFEAGATLGGGSTGEPNGTQGNEFVIDSLDGGYTVNAGPALEMWDIYYKYEVAETGTIECTADAGGSFYFAINDAYGYDWSSPATSVDVTAGDVLYINFYNTTGNDITGTIAYAAGAPAGEPVASGTESVASTDDIKIYYTPDADGILTVTISADPGYKIWVYENATDATVGLAKHGTSGTYEYELTAGVEYRIEMIGYYNWAEADATITYDITYAAQEIELPPVEIDKSDVVLALGENNVNLLENTIVSLFDFVPAEAGTYTFTVPAGVTLELYGYAAWNLMDTAVDGVLEVEATAAEQTIMIGLSGDVTSVNVTIAKTGEYIPPAQTTYLDYTPTVTVDTDFEMPAGEVLSVDITEAQTVVLGNDGYYHLGTYAGPILYVNLNSDGFALGGLFAAGAPITMRGEKFTGEDGELYCYDYMDMIAYGDYYTYSQVGDYYPLNADLMAFFQDYGAAQGWYTQGLSGFSAINEGGFDEDSAWLVTAVYIEGNNGSATDPNGGNQGGNEGGNQGGNEGGNQGGNTGNEGGNTGNTGNGGNAQTGDFGVIAAVIALTASAIGGTAVIAKKKEN